MSGKTKGDAVLIIDGAPFETLTHEMGSFLRASAPLYITYKKLVTHFDGLSKEALALRSLASRRVRLQ